MARAAVAAAGGYASSFLFAKGVIVVKCWFIGLAKGLKRYMHLTADGTGWLNRLKVKARGFFFFPVILAIVKAYFLVLPPSFY